MLNITSNLVYLTFFLFFINKENTYGSHQEIYKHTNNNYIPNLLGIFFWFSLGTTINYLGFV